MDTFEEFQSLIRGFAAERDWEKFHSPKNLAMAVSGEAGELVAEFQWMTERESEIENLDQKKLQAVKMEIADVLIYLLRLADVLNVNLSETISEKIEINRKRFL